jgi:hypothetical protein
MLFANRSARRLAPSVSLVAVILAVCWSSTADAQMRVQGPSRASQDPSRVTAVKKARSQRVSPTRINELGQTIGARVAAGGEASLRDPSVREALATAPLQARLEVFKQAAEQRGLSIQTFQRRLRGMVKNGKRNGVVSSKKTFFEVTAESFDLFPKVMGEGVIWFAASASPGHLHTLLSDQDGGPNFTHNTYGQGPLTGASMPREQYIAPAQLTGAEMDRFTRYLNASVDSGDKRTVYGFKSRGQLVCNTACTNWATSAPVGDLHRWVRSVDKKVAGAARGGTLDRKYEGGLHAVLAAAETPEQRAAVLAEVNATPGLSKITRSQIKRLGKEFDLVTKTWPNRPKDLVGRESLASLMGVARSQDPAKFMYDLMMSKRVPVIGVLNQQREANFANKTFDMEIMGVISATGDVERGNGWNTQGLGVVPADRRPGAQAAPAATQGN